MPGLEVGVKVGILGQWASGKSTAANTLVEHLGGEGQVIFLTDLLPFARQARDHILELEDSKLRCEMEEDGRQRLEGEQATIWLQPDEEPGTIDLSTLKFDVRDEVLPVWLNRARMELGRQICKRSGDGKPIVIEAGFGKNPSGHTISDLFTAFEEAGVGAQEVKWILVEAGYNTRFERNEKRPHGPPVAVFARYAADGGDLEPDQQRRLEERGVIIKRVRNDHDDVARFRADIIAAFEAMFAGR